MRDRGAQPAGNEAVVPGHALHLATAGRMLARALSHAAGSLEDVVLDWDTAFQIRSPVWTPADEGRTIVLRAEGPQGVIGMRARCGAAPDCRPVPAVLEAADLQAAPIDGFEAWLEELRIVAEPSGFLRNGVVRLGSRVVDAALAVDVDTPGTAIAAALAAAFGIASLAEHQVRHVAKGGMRPITIERMRRHGSRAPARVVGRERSSMLSRLVLDLALLDSGGQVVLTIDGATFLPPETGRALAIIDRQVLFDHGAMEARSRLTSLYAERFAATVGLAAQDVPLDEPLAMLGVDSLMMMEMRRVAELTLGIELPADRVSSQGTLRQLADIAIREIERQMADRSDPLGYAHFMNPALNARLAAVGMARAYVRAHGSIMVDAEEREVIDLVAQFGALPFGFNPAEIWEAIKSVEISAVPSMAAFSIPVAATRLAERLIELAPHGLQRAYFCSTGAEAVESALKLSYAATGRRRVLSTHDAFHGLTLGALSATGRASYQQAFGAPIDGFDKVQYGDAAALERAIEQAPGAYAAFIVEPIQAEGGIIVPPADYLREAGRLCRAHGIVFVVDEIQTGLGRCGRLFASEASGAEPDVLLLAKALGGGLVPFASMLYRAELATDAFMLRHGSTFANNALGCAAAMRTLDLLTAHDQQLLQGVRSRGAALKERLQSLQLRYPAVIEAVRGEGYLIGVAFAASASSYPRSVASLLCRTEAFGLILSSYMLCRHGVRTAPVGAGPATLRLEPALNIAPSLLDRAADAIAELADVLDGGDSPALLGHLIGPDEPDSPRTRRRAGHREVTTAVPATGERRFAFLVHLMDGDDIGRFDASLAGMKVQTPADARRLLASALRPAVLSTFALHTPDGRVASGDLILIPHAVSDLLQMAPADAHRAVLDGVLLAAERGARIVGLGGFCSVVTEGGRAIADASPTALTTGNALTALSAARLTCDAMARQKRPPAARVAMVIGALGSIGQALVRLVAPHVGRLILVGRPSVDGIGRRRLERLRDRIIAELRDGGRDGEPGSIASAALAGNEADLLARFDLADDAAAHWRQANCIFTATSATGLLVDPADLAPEAIVCDISRPINVPRELATQRPDVLLLEGGVLAPHPPFDCGIDLGIGRDHCYACMAETMLLALEESPDRGTSGPTIEMAVLPWLEAAARRAGLRTVESSRVGPELRAVA